MPSIFLFQIIQYSKLSHSNIFNFCYFNFSISVISIFQFLLFQFFNFCYFNFSNSVISIFQILLFQFFNFCYFMLFATLSLHHYDMLHAVFLNVGMFLPLTILRPKKMFPLRKTVPIYGSNACFHIYLTAYCKT